MSYNKKKYINLIRYINLLLFSLAYISSFLYFKFILRYKWENYKEIRKKFQQEMDKEDRILICPNHLTYVDSIIILVFLVSPFAIFHHYKYAPWNIPKVNNIKSILLKFVTTFMCKSLPINLNNPRDIKITFDALATFIKKKDPVLIFPEGTRSETGRVNTKIINKGVGKLVQQTNATVFCVYLRSNLQDKKTLVPPKLSKISISWEKINFETNSSSISEAKNISNVILNKISDLEKDYFKNL